LQKNQIKKVEDKTVEIHSTLSDQNNLLKAHNKSSEELKKKTDTTLKITEKVQSNLNNLEKKINEDFAANIIAKEKEIDQKSKLIESLSIKITNMQTTYEQNSAENLLLAEKIQENKIILSEQEKAKKDGREAIALILNTISNFPIEALQNYKNIKTLTQKAIDKNEELEHKTSELIKNYEKKNETETKKHEEFKQKIKTEEKSTIEEFDNKINKRKNSLDEINQEIKEKTLNPKDEENVKSAIELFADQPNKFVIYLSKIGLNVEKITTAINLPHKINNQETYIRIPDKKEDATKEDIQKILDDRKKPKPPPSKKQILESSFTALYGKLIRKKS